MKYILIALLFFLLFRLGLFYFFPVALTDGGHVAFTASLFEDPKIVGSNQEFSVRFGTFWNSTKITVITANDQELSYGQTLTIIGNLRNKVLKNKRAYFVIQTSQIEAKNSGLLPIFGLLRGKIINFCENNFSQPYSGLLIGIIFGIKSLLTQGITRSFRITGVAHVVAASGMNVTLVAGFLFGFFGNFLHRRWAIGVSIAGILVYVALSGFDASIVRAALMGSLAFSASFFGRQYSSLYILLLVAAGMLIWDPLLLTDVGFQLSFLATAGILLIKPHLSGSFISDDLGTTLAAQIATLPILLATFGQYSLLSIIVNAIILWTIPLITVVGAVGIFVGLIFEPLGKFIVFLIIPLLWYMTQVVSFFSNHALIVQIDQLPIALSIGYYLMVAGLVIFVRKKIISQ